MLNFQNGCLRLKKEKKGGGIESKFSTTKIGRSRGGCKRLHSRRTELKKKKFRDQRECLVSSREEHKS